MSTFSQDPAPEDQPAVDAETTDEGNDKAVADAETEEGQPEDPEEGDEEETLDEELEEEVEELTPPDEELEEITSEDVSDFSEAVDGTVRNKEGKIAFAPHGSYNAAKNGVQTDASGHVDSVGTDNSSKSGVRV